MIAIIAIVGLLLLMAWNSSANNIKRANAEIEAELGDRYNPTAAGKPYRDGCVIVLLAVVLTLALATVAGSMLPLLPE